MVQLGESVQVSLQSAISYVQKSATVSISMISILTRLNHQVFRISDLSRLPDINVEGRAVEEKEQRLSISCEFDILGWTKSVTSSYFSSVLI